MTKEKERIAALENETVLQRKEIHDLINRNARSMRQVAELTEKLRRQTYKTEIAQRALLDAVRDSEVDE